MNKEAMQHQILEELAKKLGKGFQILIEKVLKTNLELDGMVIMQDGENVSPTIYLEPFYEALEGGADMDDVTNRILQNYFTARSRAEHFDVAPLSDFGYVKDRLYVQLINRHSNEKLLKHIPHAMFLDDFAVTVRCMIDSSGDYNASFLIHDHHLSMWKTDGETLLSYALQNTRKNFGVDLMRMTDFLQKIHPEIMLEGRYPEDSIWIMTNKRKLAGASAMLFDDVLEGFAEKHGSFYVIFSSIHEALLIPSPNDSDIGVYTRMNQEVNEAQVEAEEILDTKAYYYRKGSGFVLHP
ncbi:MAG: DUF5688 family protein [Lachnospiraceae bacterium]|nr:DUF5688 family protein [Lachnospiraceae bacterium]MCM1237702.1 DUF5688 family protein [Ruminococcus flavefaciens]